MRNPRDRKLAGPTAPAAGGRTFPLLATLAACAVLASWCAAALALQQPLWHVQKSASLLHVGAVNGELLRSGEWWRIASSQFLHVHFLHMLFNAACLAIVGSALERRLGAAAFALVFAAGGSLGQLASVLAYPQLVSSGASQALMALCGAALIAGVSPRARRFAAAVAIVQLALDVYVAHTVKAGHAAGFVAGLVLALAWRRVHAR